MPSFHQCGAHVVTILRFSIDCFPCSWEECSSPGAVVTTDHKQSSLNSRRVLSHSWGLEVQVPVVQGQFLLQESPFLASLWVLVAPAVLGVLGLWTHQSSLCPGLHVAFPSCLCLSFLSYKDSGLWS